MRSTPLGTNDRFIDFSCEELSRAPNRAYFWETPPLTTARLERTFECVLLDAVALTHMPTDRGAFAHALERHTRPDGIACFPNLSGDAQLRVPEIRSVAGAYPHLAAFVRRAPREPQRALWRNVGREIDCRLGQRPLWVSTSGLGVAWLDERPKYYQHRPFVAPPDAPPELSS